MKKYSYPILEELFTKDLESPMSPVLFEGEYVYPMDIIKVEKGDEIEVTMLKNESKNIQILNFWGRNFFEVGGEKLRGYTFIMDPMEEAYKARIKIKWKIPDGVLEIENGWEEEGDRHLEGGNTGMKVLNDKNNMNRTYICNSGFTETNFKDLVFSIKFLNKKPIESVMDERIPNTSDDK